MNTVPMTQNNGVSAAVLETTLLQGDLSKLNSQQRVEYMTAVCKSMGLNPLTKPFEFISLNGKLVMYAKRDCTEQLRKIHKVSIKIARAEAINGIFLVVAEATDGQGRVDASTGAVSVEGLKGDNLSNALMKAETKAKRRVTLSICGLGMLDESEVDSIPQTQERVIPPAQQAMMGNAAPTNIVREPVELGEYVCTFGKYKGMTLKEVGAEDVESYAEYIEKKAKEDGKPLRGQVSEFLEAAHAFVEETHNMGNIPY